MMHNDNNGSLCCFCYQTPNQIIAITVMNRTLLWHIDLNHSADFPPLPSGLIYDWLQSWFADEGALLPPPPLRPPRHILDAAMRLYLWGIPIGETRTYGDMATKIGTSPRGAGRLLGANPLPIVVPCHRIVARHGMGGFHGGQGWKRELLDHELRKRNKHSNAAPVTSANQSKRLASRPITND